MSIFKKIFGAAPVNQEIQRVNTEEHEQRHKLNVSDATEHSLLHF